MAASCHYSNKIEQDKISQYTLVLECSCTLVLSHTACSSKQSKAPPPRRVTRAKCALPLHATLRLHQAAEVDEVLERNILRGRVVEPLSMEGRRKEVDKGQEFRANLGHNKRTALETRLRRAHACYHRLVFVCVCVCQEKTQRGKKGNDASPSDGSPTGRFHVACSCVSRQLCCVSCTRDGTPCGCIPFSFLCASLQ